LVDEKSLAAFEAAIDVVEGKPTFSLDHIQVFTLAISVREAQIRDCIRLAFDAPWIAISIAGPASRGAKVRSNAD
jgi:hypothetical protein